MTVPKDDFHAPDCGKRTTENCECSCLAGSKGLARRSEGVVYTSNWNGKKSVERRLRQINRGKKECTTSN